MLINTLISLVNAHFAVLVLIASIGLGALWIGGDLLCKGASSLATRLAISPIIIGLTIVSAATSMPELITSLYGAYRGNPGIATGNIIGSNLVNSTLILGIAALIFPIHVHLQLIKKEVPFLILATLFFSGIAYTLQIPKWAGILLLIGGLVYLRYITSKNTQFSQTKTKTKHIKISITPLSLKRSWIYIALSILMLEIGAEMLVESSIEMALRWGVSDALIGLTIVALGTSLPELATSVVAALQKQSDICVGNIVGSNLFNLFFIGGSVASLMPLAIDSHLLYFDIPALLAITLIFSVILITDRAVTRTEGFVLLLAYIIIITISIGIELY